MRLILNVLFNDLICDIAAAATEVSARPQRLPPEFLSQVRKLLEQLVGRLPFQRSLLLFSGHY